MCGDRQGIALIERMYTLLEGLKSNPAIPQDIRETVTLVTKDIRFINPICGWPNCTGDHK
jgi:hypothetical protein